MATQPALVQLSVVPDAQTQKQIENTIDAPPILTAAIEEFEKQRADAEIKLSQSVVEVLGADPQSVGKAIALYQASKTNDEALAAKIEACKALLTIIEKRIEELKTKQPGVLNTALHRKLEQLEKEAAAEQDKAALLKEQIDSLKALLHELEKPARTAAKRKKE
jgi:hypothetical protein